MARRISTFTPFRRRDLTYFPPPDVEHLPAPPPGPAIGFRGVQIALWRRFQRSLRAGAVTVGCVVAAVIPIGIFGTSNGGVNFIVFMLAMVGLFAFIAGSKGAVGCWRILRFLRRHVWTEYVCVEASLYRSPPTMTLMGSDGACHYVTLRAGFQSSGMRAMIRPEVWFVGDPDRRGILTVAGGGDMVRTRSYRPRPGREFDPESLVPISHDEQSPGNDRRPRRSPKVRDGQRLRWK